MHDLIRILAQADSTPMPTPSMTVDPELVTPGPWGFAIFGFVALAVVLLVADMLRRIRRARVRADIADELRAEQQAADAQSATETDDEAVDAADDDQPRP